MRMKRVGLLVLLICVVVVGAVIGLRAQAKPPVDPQTTDERIITGSDLGFRIDERTLRGVTGTLVVRVDGRWVPVNLPGTLPINSR
jgi:hypothetical protein